MSAAIRAGNQLGWDASGARSKKTAKSIVIAIFVFAETKNVVKKQEKIVKIKIAVCLYMVAQMFRSSVVHASPVLFTYDRTRSQNLN